MTLDNSLDPGVRNVLPALPLLEPATMTPNWLRSEFRRLAAARPQPTLLRTLSRVDKEIAIGLRTIGLRIYRPSTNSQDGHLPVVMFFHGGGFVAGDIETHDSIAANLSTSLPAVVVSVDYRRPPENLFPAAYIDCLDATRFVIENLGAFTDAAGVVAVAGDSAGGNLAAGVAIAGANEGFPLKAQLLIYPTLDLRGLYGNQEINALYPSRQRNARGYYLTTPATEWFVRQYMGDQSLDASDAASPLIVVPPKNLAPAVICVAEFDPLRDEGLAYADRLDEAGVPVRRYTGAGLIHGYFSFTAQVSPAAARETAAVIKGLATLLQV